MSNDDIKHALTQLLAFYDKELTPPQWAFWYSVLSKFPQQEVLQAIGEYPNRGKYSPKPAHLIEIMEENKQHRSTVKHDRDEGYTRCPERIATAWRWYIAKTSKGTTFEVYQEYLKGVDAETEEKYLWLVNTEALACNQPDAVADEHKLKAVWGDTGTI